jgi:hypothetical protein
MMMSFLMMSPVRSGRSLSGNKISADEQKAVLDSLVQMFAE